MTPDAEELFKSAREKGDIAQLSGVRRGKRGACPFCQKEGKKKDTAFSHSRRGLWYCFRCRLGGDVIQLVCNLEGYDARIDAARHILGLPIDGTGDGSVQPETDAAKAKRERTREERRQRDERSREASHNYHGRVIAEMDDPKNWAPALMSARLRTWLGEARGLPIDLLSDALEILRSVPRAHYAEDFETGEIHELPAMVAVIEGASGWKIGRHVTYLTLDGKAKAEVDAPRKMWGSSRGGVWLTARDNELGPLFVAEGIETALSMLAGWRRKHGATSGRALAVLSLGNFSGGWLLDAYGRMDPERPRPLPEQPAITWPNAGDVIGGPDHDMSPLKIKVRKQLGGTEERMLSQTDRMEVAAKLFGHWWRSAGASSVMIARPPAGMDFNDALRASRATAA